MAWTTPYTQRENERDEAAEAYSKALSEQSSPEAIAGRKKSAATTALGQADAASRASQSAAQAAARKQGMSAAQATMLAANKASEGFTNTYQNSYNQALAQENLESQNKLAAAKADYEQKKELADDKWNKGLSIFSSIFGILSDENLKVIYDKWQTQRIDKSDNKNKDN